MRNGTKDEGEPGYETVLEVRELAVKAREGGPPWLACDLEVAGVAEVVQLIMSARRTGRLDVIDPQGSRSLFFETGEFTGSTSSHTADRLGEVLWRSGRLSQDQVLIAAEQLKEGKMLGRALIELGFMEPSALRRALVDQAIQVFEAACFEEAGHLVFVADQFHRNPIRFGVATSQLVDGAIVRAREHRDLLRKLGSLDRPCDVVKPAPQGQPLEETALGLLQLATSSRQHSAQELTGRELIAKASLGRLGGARALHQLIDKGYLRPRDSAADEQLKIKRLCTAINLVMAALDEAGFGVGDQVREYLDSPPPSYEEALSGLSLAQPLDESAALQHADFITGGNAAMMVALQAVLDDALLQAGDTLPAELTARMMDRLKALGV
jgi:hypothetical protein